MTKVKTNHASEREHSLAGEKLALLAVFAHPEDEAFGPAGTLAKYASEGIRVHMVTASRETPAVLTTHRSGGSIELSLPPLREKSCSCLTLGTQRICLIDHAGKLEIAEEAAMEERLVRLIRELKPQVIVTCGSEGQDDPDHLLINRLTTNAFHASGDPTRYPQHVRDGSMSYQPKKLYYSVVPHSLMRRWALGGMAGVADSAVTTILDVSTFAEAKLRTLYCHRNQMSDDAGWLTPDRSSEWDHEYFTLAATVLHRKLRHEQDLFAGLR